MNVGECYLHVQSSINRMIIARQGGIGRLRFILLNALKYIPLFGYYFYQHCFIFMNRDNFEAHKAVATMDYIKKKQLSCWVVAYPEVDRFNPRKPKAIEKSREFAKSKDLVPLVYHLTPRVRVYDVTVVFGDGDGNCLDKSKPMPGLLAYLTKPRTLHIHLQRCPIEDVPQDHDALRSWLSSRYALKDKLFADLEEVKKAKSRQPNAEEVKAVFLKNLSFSSSLFTHGFNMHTLEVFLEQSSWEFPMSGSQSKQKGRKTLSISFSLSLLPIKPLSNRPSAFGID
nr:hypothetical transcript [Hymenolepis microstoma]